LRVSATVTFYSSLLGVIRRKSNTLAADVFPDGRFIHLSEGVRDALESEFASSRDGCKEFIRHEMRKSFRITDDTQPARATDAVAE
jgi:hypothetical protein